MLENETLNAEQITALYETGKMPETFDGDNTEEVEEPVKETPVSTDDDLLDEMK